MQVKRNQSINSNSIAVTLSEASAFSSMGVIISMSLRLYCILVDTEVCVAGFVVDKVIHLFSGTSYRVQYI